MRKEVETNRQKLKGIVETIRLCGIQNIPLRGHCDWGRLQTSAPGQNDGNFRSLLRYRIDGGDQMLKDHIENSSGNAMYTSPRIQNALIDSFCQIIQNKVVEQVKESQFYTVLADETTDISQVEQFSLCLRYITNTKPFIIKEDFLGFAPVVDVTGEALLNVIQSKLTEFGLDLSNLRGQGYDGASSMRGQIRGVQFIIKRKYPKAIYTHCVSHSLNLCLSDAFRVQNVRNAMGAISETCPFFRASAKRTHILEKQIRKIKPESSTSRIKTLCKIRWCDRHEAVLLFKEYILPIVSALEHISELPGDHCKKSSLVLNSICSSSFIVCLVVTSKLLGITYNLSKYLQKEDLDLFNAIKQVKSTKKTVEDLRNNAESAFYNLFENIQEIASDLNLAIDIRRTCSLQRHRPNPLSTNPEAYYRITVFIPCTEDLISSLTERFLAPEETVSTLQCVIPKYCDVPFSTIENVYKFYKDDLNGFYDVFRGEWELWREKWRDYSFKEKPTTAIDGLANCNIDLFPNIHILLKMQALLHVSTASVERSLSKLKLIKTYLRNTMSENRLNGLTMMYIHREMALKLSNEDILDHFVASGNSRRLQLTL